eukprot:GHVS01022192.1.p1 GENE.GHVS01022192.1~~GHVS01022192.1.p1  ORF type:complete len:599 (-),score=179.60 GHVS01022192.1:165-1769(-)
MSSNRHVHSSSASSNKPPPYHRSYSPVSSLGSSPSPVYYSRPSSPPSSSVHPLGTPQFYNAPPASSSSSLYLAGVPTPLPTATTSTSATAFPPPPPPPVPTSQPFPHCGTNKTMSSSSLPLLPPAVAGGAADVLTGELLARSLVGGVFGGDMASLAASGVRAAAAGGGQVSQLQSWFPEGMSHLRRYFAVSHSYVIRKLFFVSSPLLSLLLSRFSSSQQRRRRTTPAPFNPTTTTTTTIGAATTAAATTATAAARTNFRTMSSSPTLQHCNSMASPQAAFSPPSAAGHRLCSLYSSGSEPTTTHHHHASSNCGIEDVCQAELYIPLMALVSYVLVFGVIAGTTGKFTPEVLGSTATFAVSLLVVEVAVAKLCFYLCGSSGDGGVSTIDLLALCGYKFVNVVAIIIGCLVLACFADHVGGDGGYEQFWGGGGGGGGGFSWKRMWGGGGRGGGEGGGVTRVIQSNNIWSFALYWVVFGYFSCSSAVATLYMLHWYSPGQTENASNWELHLKSSKTLKYLMVAVALAQLPLCALLCP